MRDVVPCSTKVAQLLLQCLAPNAKATGEIMGVLCLRSDAPDLAGGPEALEVGGFHEGNPSWLRASESGLIRISIKISACEEWHSWTH